MSNEIFIAFWSGVAGGLVLGIIIAAIFNAWSRIIDGG